MNNPSLLEEPLDSRARVLSSGDTISILDWLKQEGRMIDAKPQVQTKAIEEDISDLMGDELVDDYKQSTYDDNEE
ncbi:MAG: DUF3134 family protein [Cyanobacteria bacterium J06642_2]